MDRIVSRLLIYGKLRRDPVIAGLCRAVAAWRQGTHAQTELIAELHTHAAAILSAAVSGAWEGDLWHAYLTRLIALDENAFSLACEGAGRPGGTTEELARRDLALILELFAYDFAPMERALGIDCLSALRSFRAGRKRAHAPAEDGIAVLCRALEQAPDGEAALDCVAGYYRDRGVGLFGLAAAFRLGEEGLQPVLDARPVTFDDLVGYDRQKQELRAAALAFVEGKSANNILLYGDSGTGKSTCVKAVLNEFRGRGLRMIEVYKHQFDRLAAVISGIKDRNYRFVIFIDDLSFEENEVEYKFLKAVIEGGVEARPDNVVICATSNRRHLIRETWTDRSDMEYDNDLHRSDTVEEKLSLSQRFGVLIHFESPDRKRFFEIVDALAARRGLVLDERTLHERANAWELRHGGLSGRTARQFVDDLAGRQ